MAVVAVPRDNIRTTKKRCTRRHHHPCWKKRGSETEQLSDNTITQERIKARRRRRKPSQYVV